MVTHIAQVMLALAILRLLQVSPLGQTRGAFCQRLGLQITLVHLAMLGEAVEKLSVWRLVWLSELPIIGCSVR